ncbi:D-alanyl-D-alanine carboxypeptidase [Paracoccus sediminis]|uniref:serine-type D-Ala-D-Ala carboxypeptidase n=1 Tax=Paracoccus sediminis TaxID=1214787 RepID=A0A238WCA6_9RHOB|nr:D-alanyl-D-alanine carboxypeptidase family protein [Paracoccus sediminis]TBN50951.1 D-alanyl-D-alanine carboxypeptidase [Paracoccus sediminis]SNR44047.1 D-alanyl-D-alanine carboxypeptidase (penicillin-binding protein 5/6) [Paracoccus sediminis]
MRTFLLRLLALLSLAAPVQAFETTANSAWVYDVNTSTVLMAKNANAPIPPASMSKLMTLYMVFEALENGRLKLTDTLPVSTKAWQMGGSKMFVEPRDTPTVEQLIKGVIVLSGNDACVVLAEGLAGTEEAFARQMTERAKRLGLKQSVFKNSTGWPAEGHVMSAEDLGILAMRLIQDFPQYYGDFALTEFRYMDRVPSNRFNRNPILGLGIGADGLKTGHTQEAGYGLVGSAVQNGRRVIFVVSGLQSEMARAEESERIVNWAFRQFSMETLVPPGDTVLEAPVWLGTKSRVGLTTRDGVNVLIPAGSQDQVRVEAVYDAPIPAPIARGDQIGRLVVTVPGAQEAVIPLLAAEDVPETGFAGRMKGAVLRLGSKAVEAAGL